MNYGRYFRLNQALSKVEDGVAIYDYVDLPAYFGPSEENPMSPKYPISVTVTSDTVFFRLHYSAFKLDKSGDSDFPQYAYDKDDIDKKALNRKQVDIGMAHMEEIILVLPYNDSISNNLSDTIKKIYNTTFPQVIDENTSMGGRFLEQLIKKRYPINKGQVTSNDIESQLYQQLRKVSDETASYSTLWLMDLIREDRIYLYSKQIVTDDKKKKEKEIDVITGFLRKLLLDFMFDLKHSDVFQNSACYQRMYSGLMSDFFFSALMHKCEYYYYRKLIRDVIDDTGKEDRERIIQLYANNLIETERLWVDDIMSIQAEKHFEHHFKAYKWYQEIFGHYSFSCWPSWFAEPEEEMRRVCFSMIEKTSERKIKHICNAETIIECLGVERLSLKSKLANKMLRSRDESSEKISKWFLKRYDFNDVLHLHIAKHMNILFFAIITSVLFWLFDAKILMQSTYDSINESQNIRNAFTLATLFVLYYILFYELYKCLHFTKAKYTSTNRLLANIQNEVLWGNKWKIIFTVFLCIFIHLWKETIPMFLSTISFLKPINKYFSSCVENLEIQYLSVFIILVLFTILLVFWIRGRLVFNFKKSRLIIARTSLTIKKLFGKLLLLTLLILCIYLYCSHDPRGIKYFVICGLIGIFIITYYNQLHGIMPTIHPISSLHLFFPRLVAAVTAAWLTMSMGFDIYVSFFDELPQWYTASTISIVVFGFIMYEINRIMPSCSSVRKIYRSFEFLVISYCISLLVGIVVINFVGEKFLERGGTLDDFYEQYVDFKGYEGLHGFDKYVSSDSSVNIDELNTTEDRVASLVNQAVPRDTMNYARKMVDSLEYVFHSKRVGKKFVKTKDYPVVEKIPIANGKYHLFIMRDFLIMFSFIAMFWGIFIQMIFTGEKQMTEL